MPKNDEDVKRWVEAWEKAGKELDRIHLRELRHFNYEEKREFVLGLLELAHRHCQPRKTSGLVEMQRLFKKARS